MENKYKDYISYKGSRFEKKLGLEIKKEHWDFLKKDILEETLSNIKLADDWQHAVKEDDGWDKYNRLMYSIKLDKLRSQTMGEFYGNGVVD